MQKIKKVIELFEWFCQNIIWLVMLCCVGFVAVLNLLYRSKVAYVWTEDVSIERTSITALVLAVLIFVVFLIAGSKIQKIDEKILFIVFTVIYIIAGIYWIAKFCTLFPAVRNLDTALQRLPARLPPRLWRCALLCGC